MKQNELKQPFFAALLVSQRTPAPGNQLWPWPGGTSKLSDVPNETHKYPSDNDEEGETI
jgi:hypothetical protein